MRYYRNLRHRVAFSVALFSGVVSLLLAISLYWATDDLSKRLIDETLTAELDDLMARHERNPRTFPPQTAILHGYIQETTDQVEQLPTYLRPLSSGRYHITTGKESYRVVVADRQGVRFILLYNTTLQQKREHRFALLMGLAVLLTGLIAIVGGLWLAKGIIAPVTDLAYRVRKRDPRQWSSTLLVEDYPQDEVGELAQVIDHHLDCLRAYMERERTFTTDLSHELRTSLTVILSATEVLLSDDSLQERQLKRIARIDRAAREMSELGTALLLMAREEGMLRIDTQCRVAEVVHECVEHYRYLLSNKPITLNIDTDPAFTLPAERGLLFIALSNLIRNAFFYTHQGEVHVLHQQNRFVIRDSGQGIPSHQMENVFLRHFRDSVSEGAGIGLALVKRIADHYGWLLRMETPAGGGTQVTLIFPDPTHGDACWVSPLHAPAPPPQGSEKNAPV